MVGVTDVFEAGKKALEVKDIVARNQLTLEFTEKALTAQQREQALITEIAELKEKLAQMENWESEKQRYQLERLEPGLLVYTIKPGMENGEPTHKICADCYTNGKKSYLQEVEHSRGLTRWKCNNCGFDESSGKIESGPPYVPKSVV